MDRNLLFISFLVALIVLIPYPIQATHCLYGDNPYGTGFYGSCEVAPVQVKIFLMEIFIMWALIASALLLKALKKGEMLVLPLSSMAIFFTLAVTASRVERLFTNDVDQAFGGMMFLFMLGIFSFLLIIFLILKNFRRGMTGQDVEGEI